MATGKYLTGVPETPNISSHKPLSTLPPSFGEFLSLASMDVFLRSVQPEVNDLFVLSLLLINLLAWMDLFITQVRFSSYRFACPT